MILCEIFPWVLIISLTLFHGLCARVDSEMGTRFDDTCVPTNCSQAPFERGLTPFPCTIGHRAECDAANFSRVDVGPAYYSFALLATIGTYLRGPTKNPSLIFSLNTPFGGDESLKTKAIRVDFHSPKEYGGDVFYADNHRCRLFDFSTAKRTDFDITHPREIRYDCLVGLSISNEITYYYNLKLTSLPSRAFTDYSIVVHKEPRRQKKYKLVLAVAAIPLRRSIHAVWERPWARFKVTRYTVFLSHRDSNITVSRLFGDESMEFTEQPPGDYTVQVVCQTANGSLPFPITMSRSVRLLYLTEAAPTSESLLKTSLAVVSGVVAGAVLLVVIVCCYYKKKPSQERVCIVYHASDATHVRKVSPVLEQMLQVRVVQVHQGNDLAYNSCPTIIICSRHAARNSTDTPNNQNFCSVLNQIDNTVSPFKLFYVCLEQDEHIHQHQNQHQHIDTKRGRNTCFTKLKRIVFIHREKKPIVYRLAYDSVELGKQLCRQSHSSIDWTIFRQRIEQTFPYYSRNSIGTLDMTDLGISINNLSPDGLNDRVPSKVLLQISDLHHDKLCDLKDRITNRGRVQDENASCITLTTHTSSDAKSCFTLQSEGPGEVHPGMSDQQPLYIQPHQDVLNVLNNQRTYPVGVNTQIPYSVRLPQDVMYQSQYGYEGPPQGQLQGNTYWSHDSAMYSGNTELSTHYQNPSYPVYNDHTQPVSHTYKDSGLDSDVKAALHRTKGDGADVSCEGLLAPLSGEASAPLLPRPYSQGDVDSNYDRVSFVPPGSDEGSLGGFTIAEESGEFIIAPKHMSHNNEIVPPEKHDWSKPSLESDDLEGVVLGDDDYCVRSDWLIPGDKVSRHFGISHPNTHLDFPDQQNYKTEVPDFYAPESEEVEDHSNLLPQNQHPKDGIAPYSQLFRVSEIPIDKVSRHQGISHPNTQLDFPDQEKYKTKDRVFYERTSEDTSPKIDEHSHLLPHPSSQFTGQGRALPGQVHHGGARPKVRVNKK